MHFPFTSATVHFLHSRGNSNQRHNGPKFPDWHFIPQVGSSKYKINKRNTERTPRICDFIIRQISARHVWSFGSKFEVGLQPPINCQKDEEFGCRADQALFIQFGPMRCSSPSLSWVDNKYKPKIHIRGIEASILLDNRQSYTAPQTATENSHTARSQLKGP